MNPHPRIEGGMRFRVGEQVICYRRGAWWSAEFYANGRQQRIALKTRSKKEATRQAACIEIQLAAGTFGPAPPDITITEVIETYLEKARTEDCAASTIKRYEPELKRLQDFFEKHGATRVGDITLALAERYRAERKPHVAAATLYHESTLLKQLANYAHDRGFIATNPLSKLKLKRPKPASTKTYTLDEVDRIIAAAGVYADLIELLAFTGLRIGEARWLTWRDIDLDGVVLHVRAKPGEWKPKDDEDRSIPLHGRLVQLLTRRPQRHRFVFTAASSASYPKGDHQISDRHVLLSLKRILKCLGITDNTVHGFRHFFVSFCANNGVDPFKLIQWTGHSELKTVLLYYNLSDEESQRAMGAVPFGSTEADTMANQDSVAGRAQNKHNSKGSRSE